MPLLWGLYTYPHRAVQILAGLRSVPMSPSVSVPVLPGPGHGTRGRATAVGARELGLRDSRYFLYGLGRIPSAVEGIDRIDFETVPFGVAGTGLVVRNSHHDIVQALPAPDRDPRRRPGGGAVGQARHLVGHGPAMDGTAHRRQIVGVVCDLAPPYECRDRAHAIHVGRKQRRIWWGNPSPPWHSDWPQPC